MGFENKVVVITGAANGIGLCIAREFAKKKSKIAFVDLDKAAGEKALVEINSFGAEGLYYCGDIAEKAVLEGFASEVIKRYGKVDYLINNACLSRKGILSGCDFEDFNYVLRVGVTAPYLLSKLFMAHFEPNGSIVNISSTRAFMSQEDTESYTAAKGGITALTHALAVSLAGKVRVNSISPGWIDVSANYDEDFEEKHKTADKRQHPSGRIGRPIDIAKTVMFLCDEDNSFVTGENITVDGGMMKQMIYNEDFGWKFTDK